MMKSMRVNWLWKCLVFCCPSQRSADWSQSGLQGSRVMIRTSLSEYSIYKIVQTCFSQALSAYFSQPTVEQTEAHFSKCVPREMTCIQPLKIVADLVCTVLNCSLQCFSEEAAKVVSFFLFPASKNIKMFVLDEADEMLSRGFKDQIYEIFQKLSSSTQVRWRQLILQNSNQLQPWL